MFGFAYNNIFDRNSCKRFALKVLSAIFFICVLFCPSKSAYCYADTTYTTELESKIVDNIDSQIEKLDLTAINNYINNLKLEGQDVFSGGVEQSVKNIINTGAAFDYSSFFQYIVKVLFDDLVEFVPLLAAIVAICVICSFLGNLSPDSQGDKISHIIYFACFSLVAVLVFSVFKGLMDSANKVISGIATQMQLIFPLLLTLITSIGGSVSVSIFQPVVALLSSGIISFVGAFVFPIFIFSFVFNVVGNLSPNIKLDKCSKFLSSLFKWVIGTIFTVFMTVLSLQGIFAAVGDNLSIKTTKFALKSYVPYIGNYLSDGVGLLLASGVLIKNAVGVVGLLLLMSTIIVPVVKIIVFMLGLRLVAAVVEPLANNNISSFLYGSSKCLNMLIACIVAIAFMYLLAIGVLMCTANVF